MSNDNNDPNVDDLVNQFVDKIDINDIAEEYSDTETEYSLIPIRFINFEAIYSFEVEGAGDTLDSATIDLEEETESFKICLSTATKALFETGKIYIYMIDHMNGITIKIAIHDYDNTQTNVMNIPFKKTIEETTEPEKEENKKKRTTPDGGMHEEIESKKGSRTSELNKGEHIQLFKMASSFQRFKFKDEVGDIYFEYEFEIAKESIMRFFYSD